MTKEEIIAKVKELNLPKGSYVVFGSCPMAAAGIREANDIDLLVSEEIFKQLQKAGWRTKNKGPKDNLLVKNVFEAHPKWDFSSYNPTLTQLLLTANFIDEIPFAALEEVQKWKAAFGRPKDLKDIKLIDKYLTTKK